MHASRLVQVLLLLQVRGRLTARELATELEVSLRTIYRDLDELSAAGVPVYAERGPAGGYQLVDGYRTRLTGLNADEAEALFLSGLEGPAAQLGLGTVLAAAQLKVLAALPPELRGRAARIRERFLLEAPRWFHDGEEPACLGTVAEAVWGSRRLRMVYRGPDGEVDRLIEPLGLVLKAGTWYLVARRDGVLRTYRVSRVTSASVEPGRFERPEGFDLASHWAAASAAFQESLRRVHVTVRVAPGRMDDLVYAIGGSSRLDPPATAGDRADEADGIVRFLAEDLAVAHDDLLRLGAGVEVVDPPELRASLAATVAAMARIYPADAP